MYFEGGRQAVKELLIRIRSLLSACLKDGDGARLASAVSVALSLMEEGDLYAGRVGAAQAKDFILKIAPEDPLAACGAAFALKKKNQGGVAVCALESAGAPLDAAARLAVALQLPIVFLISCEESALDDVSSRFMALDMECIPSDGRSVMALMPSLRLAVDKAREGDGPTLIECVSDQMPEDEGEPTDPLERLTNVLILEGYAMPEELV